MEPHQVWAKADPSLYGRLSTVHIAPGSDPGAQPILQVHIRVGETSSRCA